MVVKKLNNTLQNKILHTVTMNPKESSSALSPKLLSELDDLATSLILDVFLGFQTHKMNVRYKPLRINRGELRRLIDDFIQNQNYESTMSSIVTGEWIPKSFLNKSKLMQKRLYAHVSGLMVRIRFKL
jgi:[histone H4]-N-methyl-L-lysine20 N-methyltransferase